MDRSALIAGFLEQNGYSCGQVAPLAGDASFRRYLRLTGGPLPAVLMDAPPPEDVRAFIRIGRHLASIGLSVPEIIAADERSGLLLLEDFGDEVFATVPRPETEEMLFETAVDALLVAQRAPAPALPAWGPAEMAEAALSPLLEWWWPACFGSLAPEAAKRDFRAALKTMLAALDRDPRVFVHRDFFSGNLIWLPGRTGVRRIGILDFQSAALGHPAYDLASLIYDARQEIPPGLAERVVQRYLAHTGREPERFRTALAICAAQRHLRVAGQWVRLALRDRKPHYLRHGPRTWRLLEESLAHPAASSLGAVLDRWVPPGLRGNPPGCVL
ncbi:MAG: phosphotransferase [Acetobacteraceae bacterium]|nr:phosphotransferase [Acetobacteraceae bacterium]